MLQEFTIENFPLRKYVIDVDTTIGAPAYLDEVAQYSIEWEEENVVVDMSDQQWPPKEALALDGSQYDAYKSALTKEISIIQGPPGCTDSKSVLNSNFQEIF